MPTPTAINAIPQPVSGDPPDIEGLQQSFGVIDQLLVPRFASVASRNSAIPAPVAGQLAWCSDTSELYRHTGTSWISAAPRWVHKPISQASDQYTTYVADNHLFVPLEAGGLYEVRVDVYMQSTPTAKFKFKFATPTGCVGNFSMRRFDIASNTYRYTRLQSWSETGDSIDAATGGVDNLIFEGRIALNAAGTLQLLWAQGTTHINNFVWVHFNSTIRTEKIV